MSIKLMTIEDFKELLSIAGIKWSGKFYSSKELDYIDATNENFFSSSIITAKLQCSRFKKIEITFSLFTFKTEDKDYSTLWQNILLKNHDKEYSKLLYLWSTRMCESLMNEHNKLISKTVERMKCEAEKHIQPYKTSLEKATANLTEEEIAELNKC